MSNAALVVLATAASQLEAEMWQEYLADAGIMTVCQPGNGAVYLGVAVPCRLWVAASRLAEGRALLAELVAAPAGETSG